MTTMTMTHRRRRQRRNPWLRIKTADVILDDVNYDAYDDDHDDDHDNNSSTDGFNRN